MNTPLALFHHLPSPARLSRRLDEARARWVDDVLSRNEAAVSEARAALRRNGAHGANPKDDANGAIEVTARKVLKDLRRRARHSSDATVVTAASIDDLVRSERLEWLDRAGLPEAARRAGMRLLHMVNVLLDSYGVWARVVDEVLGDASPAHVYDLAAGTGGFACYLAEQRRGLRLTSSDVDASYVAIGQAAARRRSLDVSFEARDAMDLVGVRDVDLFVCTQATHHLAPGQVVRMIASCVQNAERGILIVDLQRSVFNMVATGALLAAVAPPLMHDGILSVQRSYSSAELTLLARLAGAREVRAFAVSPAFTAMHAYGTT